MFFWGAHHIHVLRLRRRGIELEETSDHDDAWEITAIKKNYLKVISTNLKIKVVPSIHSEELF